MIQGNNNSSSEEIVIVRSENRGTGEEVSRMRAWNITSLMQKEFAYKKAADIKEIISQVAHRVELLRVWNVKAGERILEVGCGHGDTTVVLAEEVGDSGHVVAVDTAPLEYGTPSLEEAHDTLRSSYLGKRITFQTSFDLLNPEVIFPEQYFDLVVFSHNSWYLSEADELLKLFARVRPWAKRLGYAEWYIVPQNSMHVPHMMAALVQLHLQTFIPGNTSSDRHLRDAFNIRTLILPADTRRMTEQTGWTIKEEEILNSSNELQDGQTEEFKTLGFIEKITENKEMNLPKSAYDLFLAEKQLLLNIMVTNTQVMSLSTYAFLAE